MERKFKRILLKLSGESLMGEQQYGIDPKRAGEYAAQIKEIAEMGIEIGIVIGGGNIFRERCYQRFRSCKRRPNGYVGYCYQ